MITKLLLSLFVPFKWTIINTAIIKGSRTNRYSGNVTQIDGTQYTLQNQYGDIKFKTVWLDGKEGEYY